MNRTITWRIFSPQPVNGKFQLIASLDVPARKSAMDVIRIAEQKFLVFHPVVESEYQSKVRSQRQEDALWREVNAQYLQ